MVYIIKNNNKMSLTNSSKDEFSTWMLGTLVDNKDEIIAKDANVTYDVDGNIAKQKLLDTAYLNEAGKSAKLKKAWMDQNKKVNAARNARYTNASAMANGISSHMGEDDQLSIIIHQERGSLVNIANRGPRKPKV